MKSLILGLAAAASLAVALPAAAQGVDAAGHRQAESVKQGVRSGALTPQETGIARRHETRLHRYEARQRRLHHGHLTPAGRHAIVQADRRDSHLIYRLKHNHRVG